MRRFILVCLVSVLVCGLCGCGEIEEENSIEPFERVEVESEIICSTNETTVSGNILKKTQDSASIDWSKKYFDYFENNTIASSNYEAVYSMEYEDGKLLQSIRLNILDDIDFIGIVVNGTPMELVKEDGGIYSYTQNASGEDYTYGKTSGASLIEILDKLKKNNGLQLVSDWGIDKDTVVDYVMQQERDGIPYDVIKAIIPDNAGIHTFYKDDTNTETIDVAEGKSIKVGDKEIEYGDIEGRVDTDTYYYFFINRETQEIKFAEYFDEVNNIIGRIELKECRRHIGSPANLGEPKVLSKQELDELVDKVLTSDGSDIIHTKLYGSDTISQDVTLPNVSPSRQDIYTWDCSINISSERNTGSNYVLSINKDGSYDLHIVITGSNSKSEDSDTVSGNTDYYGVLSKQQLTNIGNALSYVDEKSSLRTDIPDNWYYSYTEGITTLKDEKLHDYLQCICYAVESLNRKDISISFQEWISYVGL